MRANIETSKAVGEIGKQSEKLKYQEGNGFLNDRRLESFGHLLADYVLTGAELTVDSIQSNKIHISEGIISFSDQLWRVFISEFIIPANTTYFVGFLTGTGYILSPTEPLKDYMKLWTIEVDANGVVTKQTDHRGKLNRVKFKAIYDGVYLNTEEIKDAVATITGAVADAELAVTTATTAIAEAEKAIGRADGAVTRTNAVIETANQSVSEINAIKDTANQLVLDVQAAKEDSITQTAKTVKATNDAIQVTGSVDQKLTDVQKLAENFSFISPYSSTTIYRKNNVVYHAKGSWIYINNTPAAGFTPPALPIIQNTHWHLLAMPGENGTGTGTVTEVDGVLPGVTGVVVTHENKVVLDAFSDDGTGLKYNNEEISGKVKSVNGQEGDITGLETVVDAERKHTQTLGDAKTYTDQKIAEIEVTGGGGAFAPYHYTLTPTEEGQTDFVIPLANYHKKDWVMLFQNTTFLSPVTAYTIVEPNIIRLTNGVKKDTTTLTLTVLKNVPAGEVGSFDGSLITVNTLPMDRIIGLQADLDGKGTSIANLITDITGIGESITGIEQNVNKLILDVGNKSILTTVEKEDLVKAINEVNAKPTGGDTTGLVQQINALQKQNNALFLQNTKQDLMLARNELEKQAQNRVNGGTVFAHDMNGNIIGMTLDEINTQNIVIREGKMMMASTTEETKTVSDISVVGESQETDGNGGRKVVRLANRWLVATTRTATAYSIHYSKNSGVSWSYLYLSTTYTSIQDVSLASFGNYVYAIIQYNNTSVACNTFNPTLPGYSSGSVDLTIDNPLTANQTNSVIVDEEKMEVHAVWSCRHSTANAGWSLRYAKATISASDGRPVWGTPLFLVTGASSAIYGNPTMILNSLRNPLVIFSYDGGTSTKGIGRVIHDGSKWTQAVALAVTSAGAYTTSCPTAIFVPKSINGLEKGRIWVTWEGLVVGSSLKEIFVSYSDNDGISFSIPKQLTNEVQSDHSWKPSITATRDNTIMIAYMNRVATDSSRNLRYLKLVNETTNWIDEFLTGVINGNPSTVFDLRLSSNKPLTVAKGITKVSFNGEWQEPIETPTLTGTAVYDLPTTDYVGLSLKKGSQALAYYTKTNAFINDIPMDLDMNSTIGEPIFTKALPNRAKVKLRIELSRDSISDGEGNNIALILGGRA